MTGLGVERPQRTVGKLWRKIDEVRQESAKRDRQRYEACLSWQMWGGGSLFIDQPCPVVNIYCDKF